MALVLPSRKRRDQFKKLMSVCARVICEYLTAKTIKVLRRLQPRGAFVRIHEFILLNISRKGFGLMAQKAIVGEKVGMTQVWSDDQRVVPVTVLII